jgi:hypothetical protein
MSGTFASTGQKSSHRGTEKIPGSFSEPVAIAASAMLLTNGQKDYDATPASH